MDIGPDIYTAISVVIWKYDIIECDHMQWRIFLGTCRCHGIPQGFYIYDISRNISQTFACLSGKTLGKCIAGRGFNTPWCLFYHISTVFLINYKKKKTFLQVLEPAPLHCIQAKFTTIPINNFSNYLAQFNIYFKNVWHPQEKNLRSATVCIDLISDSFTYWCRWSAGFFHFISSDSSIKTSYLFKPMTFNTSSSRSKANNA